MKPVAAAIAVDHLTTIVGASTYTPHLSIVTFTVRGYNWAGVVVGYWGGGAWVTVFCETWLEVPLYVLNDAGNFWSCCSFSTLCRWFKDTSPQVSTSPSLLWHFGCRAPSSVACTGLPALVIRNPILHKQHHILIDSTWTTANHMTHASKATNLDMCLHVLYHQSLSSSCH